MMHRIESLATAFGPAAPIRLSSLWWVAASIAVMIAVIVIGEHWYLNFIHVMAGILWTGIDLFMGFVVGPILRRAGFDARRAVVSRLMPVMLFLMPTLAIVTTTAGWYLAVQIGFLELEFPDMWWLAAALAIAVILTIEGVFFILPINIMVNLEMARPRPDTKRVDRLMTYYVRLVASQGVLQVVIVAVMARFVSGI